MVRVFSYNVWKNKKNRKLRFKAVNFSETFKGRELRRGKPYLFTRNNKFPLPPNSSLHDKMKAPKMLKILPFKKHTANSLK